MAGTGSGNKLSQDNQTVAFLEAFSMHPAGVAVITAVAETGNPVGFTATSLASFSIAPPRASFNIARHASSYPALTVGKKVLLHFLGKHQVDVAKTMAGDSAKRFTGSHWELDELGLPRIKGVRALLVARIIAVNEVGTNASVIIEIEDGEANLDCEPLVYVDRKYHAVGDVLVD